MAYQSADVKSEQEAVAAQEGILKMDEMISDHSAELGAYLRKRNWDDLAEKLLDPNAVLDDAEKGALEDARKEVERVVIETEKLKGMLDEKMLARIAQANPEFQKILNRASSDRVREAVVSQLSVLAIEDGPKFKQIASSLEQVSQRREGFKEKDQQLEELCDRYGIEFSDIDKALEIENDRERESEIKRIIQEQRGFWRKHLVDYSSREYRMRIKSLDQRADIQRELGALSGDFAMLGRAIRNSLGSDEAQRAQTAAIRGQDIEANAIEKSASFSEAGTMIASDDDINTAWEKHKKGIPDYAAKSDADKKAITDSFIDSYDREKTKGKHGMWARIVRLWMNAKMDIKREANGAFA
ncbi:hypothetical protein KJ903_03745 [Patescibacteria group bacterium]|nr:hypothetical protein [Patescibacteria group bacterium]